MHLLSDFDLTKSQIREILDLSKKIKSILKILDQEIEFLILDMDFPQNSNMDLIDIIRRTRPRLPIIVLSEDNSLKTVRKFAQAGVFYCALKPVQVEEKEKVLEALNRLRQKQVDKVSTAVK